MSGSHRTGASACRHGAVEFHKRSTPCQRTVLDRARPKNPYAIQDPHTEIGEIVRVSDGWLLNPVSTAPITLLGATREIAEAVKGLLEQSYNAPEDSTSDLADLIEKHSLSFKELRHTLEAYRVRCLPEFERLKSESNEYSEAFAEPNPCDSNAEMDCGEIRDVFRNCWYSLKQFAQESGFPYSAVLAYFGGRKVSASIHEAAQKVAASLSRDHRRQEILSDLRFRAQELAGVPATAAEVLPIWDGDVDTRALARQIVERFRQAGAINLHQIHTIDPDGTYRTLWTISGPIDKLTRAECRELMERVFTVKEIPAVPVHPGCRCTLIIDTSELERKAGKAR